MSEDTTISVKGYKVFSPTWTCRGYQYEVGKTFEENIEPKCCVRGFHFCTKIIDCFAYYAFCLENKVAEVEAVGIVDAESGDSKCCTNKIRIIREVSWHEVLELANTGTGCTGKRNSGSHNSGDYNSASNHFVCFNTKTNKLLFFDVKTEVSMADWRTSDAYQLLKQVKFSLTRWIPSSKMTNAEKFANENHETTGGYLKTCNTSDCYKEWWGDLTVSEKEIIKQIPNFDADKFHIITGIDVNE